jgi:hypothetical protein
MGFGFHSYKESLFVAANIYLTLGLSLGLFSLTEIAEDFAEKSSYLVDIKLFLNHVFEDFVVVYLDICLEELLPYIQYSASLYSAANVTWKHAFPMLLSQGFDSPNKTKMSQTSKLLKKTNKTPLSSKDGREVHQRLAMLRLLPHVHEAGLFAGRPFLRDFDN